MMRMLELMAEYRKLYNRWNSFWQKLMAHPESPIAAVWLEKFNQAGIDMVTNTNLQIEEIQKHL